MCPACHINGVIHKGARGQQRVQGYIGRTYLLSLYTRSLLEYLAINSIQVILRPVHGGQNMLPGRT